MKNRLWIDFAKNRIMMDRTFAEKCRDTRSAEYEHLQRVRQDYPEFVVQRRQIKKNTSKETYAGLTYYKGRCLRLRSGEDGWVITLTVTFIVPMVRGIAGVWQFITKGSASSIPNIRDTFDTMLAERGFVKGIVWDMNVEFAKSRKPGNHSKYPVVSIVPNESEGNLRKISEAFKPIKLVE